MLEDTEQFGRCLRGPGPYDEWTILAEKEAKQTNLPQIIHKQQLVIILL